MRVFLERVNMRLLNRIVCKVRLLASHNSKQMKRWSLLCMMLMMLKVNANQHSSITLNEKSATLETVMKKIEEQTDYRFWFEKKLLNNAARVNINVVNVPLKTALDICFENQDLSYQIVEKTIVVKRKINNETISGDIPTVPGFRVDQDEVKGTVKNKKGEPLSGASVRVKGTNHGTSTNDKGEFALKGVSANAILEITMTGYSKRQVTMAGNYAAILIELEEEASVMGDVVVTGYQNKNKNEYAGAATTVKTKDIKVASLGTLDKMLQGQVAGVAIQNTSSTFGTAPKIRIRGSASLSGINEPLWVLDGIPLEAPLNIVPSELYAGNARNLLASALANVNPEDIEDITILKDATATAMYGTRAVNV